MAGIRRQLDVFGVLVLSFAASSFGMVRDVLLAEVPVVLRSDLYVVAALAAAAIVAGGSVLGVTPVATTIFGGLVCFCLRIMALRWVRPHRSKVVPIRSSEPLRTSTTRIARPDRLC